MPVGFLNRLRTTSREPVATAVREPPPTSNRDPGTERERFSALLTEVSAYNIRGDYADSLRAIERAATLGLGRVEVCFAKGSTFYAWGRDREALNALYEAASVECTEPALPLLLGWANYRLGRVDDALAWMDKAATSLPDEAQAHLGRGIVLAALRQYPQAIAAYRKVLELAPENVDALAMLASATMEEGDLVGAELLYRRAIGIDPRRAAIWGNLTMVLGLQGRHAEATTTAEHAESLGLEFGDPTDTYVNLGIEWSGTDRHDEAIALYERKLRVQPRADAHCDYAFELFRVGRLEEAWPHFEFRWLQEPLVSLRANHHRPPWVGQNIHGKSICIRAEQGYGETIQFGRYAGLLKAAGATVLVAVQPGLEELVETIPGVDRVLRHNERANFDYYVNLLSLPGAFGTALSTVPAHVPYVHADVRRAAQWREQLGEFSGLKVGIAWAGNPEHKNDRNRSIPLQLLSELASRRQGVRFLSLQKGRIALDEADTLTAFGIENLGPRLETFADTAAVIENLDLVISVDTSVVHLAGAMAKPSWLLLPTPNDWRWLLQCDTSPWYPTMTVFRQRERGDWKEVIARVSSTLDQVVGGAGSLLRSQPRTVATQALSAGASSFQRSPLSRVLSGTSAVAETRVGIVQYLPDEGDIGRSIALLGEYRHRELEMLGKLVSAGSTIVEAGAGIGAHALYLAAKIGPSGHAFLFEPRALHHRLLGQNLSANRVSNVTSLRRRLGAHHNNEGSRLTDSLDDLMLENLKLIKVGATGSAMDVLDGSAETIWRLRPVVHIDVQDSATFDHLCTRMKGFGYRVWRIEWPLFDSANYYDSQDEEFDGRCAVALIAIPEELEPGVELNDCVES